MLGEVLWLEISLTCEEDPCGLTWKEVLLGFPVPESSFRVRARRVHETRSFNGWSKTCSSDTLSSPPLMVSSSQFI